MLTQYRGFNVNFKKFVQSNHASATCMYMYVLGSMLINFVNFAFRIFDYVLKCWLVWRL